MLPRLLSSSVPKLYAYATPPAKAPRAAAEAICIAMSCARGGGNKILVEWVRQPGIRSGAIRLMAGPNGVKRGPNSARANGNRRHLVLGVRGEARAGTTVENVQAPPGRGASPPRGRVTPRRRRHGRARPRAPQHHAALQTPPTWTKIPRLHAGMRIFNICNPRDTSNERQSEQRQ